MSRCKRLNFLARSFEQASGHGKDCVFSTMDRIMQFYFLWAAKVLLVQRHNMHGKLRSDRGREERHTSITWFQAHKASFFML